LSPLFRHAFLLLLCAGTLFPQAPAPAPRRLALLMGNSSYKHLPPLPAVPGELDSIGTALRGAGFDVTVDRDSPLDKAQKAVFNFLAKIQPGDVCFFYFDGYAMQWGRENLLLPVDFDPAAKYADMTSAAVELIGIQQNLDQKQAGLKILVLEASRSDPSLLKQGVGLANPEASSSHEIFFAFSARPNQLVQDDKGAFTKSLASVMQKKGLSLEEVFREVQKEAKLSYALPVVTNDFYFHAPEKKPDPVPPPQIDPVVITKTVMVNEREPGALGHNSKDKEDYVWIPPGEFKMGCVPTDTKCKPEEKPQHSVKISKGLWMGRNEVKTLSYERYVDLDKKARKMPKFGPIWDEKWKKADSTFPMTELTADEAGAYCSWTGGRLPTEAEWEYSARAGQSGKIFPFSGDDDSREEANFSGIKGNDKWEQAAPVGSFGANKWGLLDMAGNVWEWCSDFFTKTYFQELADSNMPIIDPRGPSGKLLQHVVRGGSWDSDPKEHLRISFREGHNYGNTVGFRCVLPDNEATRKLLGVRESGEVK
jgi:formylglycine-generating enzyme required for sulfatase activity